MLQAAIHATPAVLNTVRVQDEVTLKAFFRMVLVHHPWDWSVYYGPESWSTQQVQEHGEKLPRSAALAMFPNVAGLYRE